MLLLYFARKTFSTTQAFTETSLLLVMQTIMINILVGMWKPTGAASRCPYCRRRELTTTTVDSNLARLARDDDNSTAGRQQQSVGGRYTPRAGGRLHLVCRSDTTDHHQHHHPRNPADHPFQQAC